MEQQPGTRSCPECGSGDYVFRGRKKIAANPEKIVTPAVETNYACRTCGHQWKVRVPA